MDMRTAALRRWWEPIGERKMFIKNITKVAWHHVTLKGQCRDPNMFGTIISITAGNTLAVTLYFLVLLSKYWRKNLENSLFSSNHACWDAPLKGIQSEFLGETCPRINQTDMWLLYFSKRVVVTSFTFQGHLTSSITWHSIPHRPFLNGGPLEPSFYLWWFASY